MADFNNTFEYAEEWKLKLQERLLEPTKFKEIYRVEYTDMQIIHNPYLTEAAAIPGYRGSSYSMQPITQTDEFVTINTFKIIPQFIDRADLAQSKFIDLMELAAKQGDTLNAAIDTAVFANHAAWTDFDNASIGGSAGNITVSATNIDNIITGIKREISDAGGEELANRNGIFIVWRNADFEILEQFCAANGYGFADEVLENGIGQGKKALGVVHYKSGRLTSGHVHAGVRKVGMVGILKSTYGQVDFNMHDPDLKSGVSITTRVDFKEKVWNNTSTVLFDVLVA